MIIAIAVVSLDGKIALSKQDNTSWSSKEDKSIFVEETKKAGIIIMGRTTWQTINKPLPNRQIIVLTKKPTTSKYPTVEFSNLPPQKLIKNLHSRGYQNIFIAGGQQIYTLFLKQKLIDQLWITIEPYLFGNQAIGLFSRLIKSPIKLKFLSTQKLNRNSIQLKYQILYGQ